MSDFNIPTEAEAARIRKQGNALDRRRHALSGVIYRLDAAGLEAVEEFIAGIPTVREAAASCGAEEEVSGWELLAAMEVKAMSGGDRLVELEIAAPDGTDMEDPPTPGEVAELIVRSLALGRHVESAEVTGLVQALLYATDGYGSVDDLRRSDLGS